MNEDKEKNKTEKERRKKEEKPEVKEDAKQPEPSKTAKAPTEEEIADFLGEGNYFTGQMTNMTIIRLFS